MENLNQVDFCYRGAIKNLSKILKEEKIKKAIIFTGKKSYELIKTTIEKELTGIDYSYYNDFEVNPKEIDIKQAIKVIENRFDIIIAIGGGSVLDFAKAYRYYSKCKKKIVAIPTTCGTGAESTQFAVIYINGVKQSLDEKSILPEYAIVDSQFVDDNPKYLKACTAMDAFCHAIESFWAVKSTDISRKYAIKAIELCRDNIVQYVNSNDKTASNNMSFAAHLAGKAINISRTTAAHALSYKITSDYKIPHGHAVALSISNLFKYNISHCKELELLNNYICNEDGNFFENLFRDIQIEDNLNTLNIFDIESIVNNINTERLSNNPCYLDKKVLLTLFKV
jgi:alcohol dehydrogenase class IV